MSSSVSRSSDTVHLPPETIERICRDWEADGADPEADIRVTAHPEDMMLVVMGSAGVKSALFPLGAARCRQSHGSSISLEARA